MSDVVEETYKIIYDTLEECVHENSDIDGRLKTKLKDILLGGSVIQTVTLDDNALEECNRSLFGSSCKDNLELNYAERNQLQDTLKLKLDKNNQDTGPTQLSPEDKVLMDYKTKLIAEQEQYVKNLLDLLELLKEITGLRLNKLPRITEQKIKECQMEERTNHLKSLLAQEKVRVDMFMETSNSLKAYKELIKDIKEQQHDCEKEIQNLRDLREKTPT
ncbi:hypothetical protein NQ318_003826 [Aromia moschata]|uniref:Uncharacterized protein n=1 Tax=Aromia moschata TaxID=1265417 RepID=A0AAV8XV79_9CUCU|nr:hypothetical protein NQ318_003826 [Aromia moschata]